MTKPANRTQKHKITQYLKRQSWALLILITVGWLIDSRWLHSDLVIVKSAAIGGFLGFATQMVFAWFMFSYTGYQARNRIVSQFFRGQALKWLLTVFGFALIFTTVEPLSAPALFIGFIIMKVSHVLMLGRIK